MAEPSTIDIQKAYNSPTEKFKNFVGGGEGGLSSSEKAMQENIGKLFDTFTLG